MRTPASSSPLQEDPLVLHGDLDCFSKDALLARLEPAALRKYVTVDLSDVRFMDASALGCFVRLHNAMRRLYPGSRVRLVGVRPLIARLFRLTRLDSVFDLLERGGSNHKTGTRLGAIDVATLLHPHRTEEQASLMNARTKSMPLFMRSTIAAIAVFILCSATIGASVPPYRPGTSHPHPGPASADAGHSLIHRPSPWGSTNRPYPLVNAAFRERVRPGSLRISLDGESVTQISKVTALGFEFTPAFPLLVGRHTVRIVGVSADGVPISDGWSFTVSSP